MPPAFWFEEIAAVFSEAKVILTVRDSAEVWVKSWKEHLKLEKDMAFLTKIAFWWNNGLHFGDTFQNAIYGSSNPEATALFRVKYRQHNERVQAVIPAERLLVFNVKQGWKPLCEFLSCDIPSTQFPRANVGHAFVKERYSRYGAKTKFTIAYIFLSAILLFVGVVIVKFTR